MDSLSFFLLLGAKDDESASIYNANWVEMGAERKLRVDFCGISPCN